MAPDCTRTVVVVDDDEDIRTSLADLLSVEGFQVAIASNGAEGLEVARRSATPCVILLDMMMPVMDGWEFLKARASDPELCKIPVLVVSALKQKLRGAHVEGVFPKPVDVAALLGAVDRFCSPQPA